MEMDLIHLLVLLSVRQATLVLIKLVTFRVDLRDMILIRCSAYQGNTWIDFNWRDTDGTQIPNAWFTAFASDLAPGYKPNFFYLGHNDAETTNSWNFRYSDGTTDAFDHQANHSYPQCSIMSTVIYPLLYRIVGLDKIKFLQHFGTLREVIPRCSFLFQTRMSCT